MRFRFRRTIPGTKLSYFDSSDKRAGAAPRLPALLLVVGIVPLLAALSVVYGLVTKLVSLFPRSRY